MFSLRRNMSFYIMLSISPNRAFFLFYQYQRSKDSAEIIGFYIDYPLYKIAS